MNHPCSRSARHVRLDRHVADAIGDMDASERKQWSKLQPVGVGEVLQRFFISKTELEPRSQSRLCMSIEEVFLPAEKARAPCQRSGTPFLSAKEAAIATPRSLNTIIDARRADADSSA